MRTILLVFFAVVTIWTVSASEESENEDVSSEDENELQDGGLFARIIGGNRVPIEKCPYTAAVIEKTRHFGSAIILNKKWVLTSGWVLFLEDPTTILVRAASDSAIESGQSSWVDLAIVNPNYTQTWENDVGLIKLKTPFKFNERTKAIKIADKPPANGTTGILTGFGIKRTANRDVHDGWLRAVTTQTISNKQCKQQYYPYSVLYSDSNYCMNPNNRKGPCDFDYGSPLVHKNTLIGLFSGQGFCLDERTPPVITDVSKYKKWILDTIKHHSEPGEFEELYKDIMYY